MQGRSARHFGLFVSILALAACAQRTQQNNGYDLAYNYGQDLTYRTYDFAGSDYGVGGDLSGRSWTDESYNTSENLFGVWSNGSGLVVASGTNATLLKSVDGNVFLRDSSSNPSIMSGESPSLLALAAVSPGPPTNPLYVVGTDGTAWSYSGGSPANGSGLWGNVGLNVTTGIYGVWIAADDTVFFVGPGLALKKNGATLTPLSGIDSNASNIWGTQTGTGYSAWVVGDDGSNMTDGSVGKIWKSTGSNFVAENPGAVVSLRGIYGFSPTDIYAVGDNGTILHSIGNGTWTAQNSGITQGLQAIGGADPDDVYAVGLGGTVLYKHGATSTIWTQETTLPATLQTTDFLNVWADQTGVYIVGASGSILKR